MKLNRKPVWWMAFYYAWQGIMAAFKHERNMKIHCLAAVIAIGLAYYYNLSHLEYCALIITIMAVFISEIFNTAIERIVDFISPQFHDEAKLIKDLAAGAVLIAAIMAISIAYLLFFDRIF